MATTMTREQMIHWIASYHLEDLQFSVEIHDGWTYHTLVEGIKGLTEYTDRELRKMVTDYSRGARKNV